MISFIHALVCPAGMFCRWQPLDNPLYLLIAGDDNVIPFYRKQDPTGYEGKYAAGAGGNAVLRALRQNDYFFTDNYYADLSYLYDELSWNTGGVELATGRLIGAEARDMSTLLQAGQYGPDTTNSARAIVASACGMDAQNIATRFVSHGYNVLNDWETPDTVDTNGWQESTLLGLMQGDYQLFYHANHANEGKWCTPPCDCGGALFPSDLLKATTIPRRIAANRPIFASNGCRAGLSPAMPGSYTVVNALVRGGASAVMVSTGITRFAPDFGDISSSEGFLGLFWQQAARHPSAGTLNMGAALRLTKRLIGFPCTFHCDIAGTQKLTSEFVLYGVPWVTAPYRVGTPQAALPTASPLQGVGIGGVSSPQAIGEQTYVFTAVFDASDYSVNQEDGFDLVEVEGMPLAYDDGVPLVPLAEVELNLPPDGAVVDVEVIATDLVDLGTLNIPMMRLGVPIPGGEPGGLEEVPSEVGVYPPQPAASRMVSLDGYNLARVYASPLTYDAATDQAILHQSLTLRITYQLSSTVGLLSLTANPTDLAPEAPFSVVATLNNPSGQSVALTGTLTLKDSVGQVVAVQEIAQFAVPAGGEPHQLALAWTAPIAEGAYDMFLKLWHDGSRQVIGRQMLSVSGGRITDLTVPEGIQPGEEATCGVTFANRRGETFEGQVTLSIYTAEGTLVTTLDAPISVGGQSEATAELVWDTGGLSFGTYVAAVTVTDDAESITYGVIQKSFSLQRQVFLPLIMRGHP